MVKKNCKKAVVLFIGLVLFSTLMLSYGGSKSLSLINYPYQSYFMASVPFGF
jgi:hypothetical protein